MAEPIQYQSNLPALINTLTGTKTTTENGANIDPLQQVFQAAMTAQGAGVPEMQQLITSIFQQGAKEVPGLIQGYANATGTRATNNSAVALAIQDLNRQMSTQAAQAILDNQQKNRQIAGQAGEGIANATKTQKQVVKPAVNPLLPILAGFALNKAGAKGGFLDKLWGDGNKEVAGSYGDTTAIGYDPGAIPVASAAPDVSSAASNVVPDVGTTLATDLTNAGGEVGNAILPQPDSGTDLPDVPDVGSQFVDTGGDTVTDPDVLSLFGWKNGGAVTDVAVKRMSPMNAPARGYADGGPVTSNSPAESVDTTNTDGGTILGVPDDLRKKKGNIGTDNPMMLDSNGNAGVGASSIATLNIAGTGGNDNNTFSASPGVGGTTPIDGLGGNEVINFDHNTPAPTVGGNEPIPDVARLAISTIVGMITHIPPPVISLVLKHLTGKVEVGPLKPVPTPSITTKTPPPDASTDTTKPDPTGTVTVSNSGDTARNENIDTMSDDAAVAASQAQSPLGTDAATEASLGYVSPEEGAANQDAVTNAIIADAQANYSNGMAGDGMGPSTDSGMAGDGMGPPDVGSGGANTDTTGGGSGGGGINIDEAPNAMGEANGGLVSALTQQMKRKKTAGNGGTGYSDGGYVKGPGTGTSDSIPTRLSNGEYVIPADVVHMFGTQALDKILAGFHTPTA